jgi:hypothetical protein
MRTRMAGVLAGLAAVVGTLAAAPAPAQADDQKIDIVFTNRGYYYAYADVWAYNGQGANRTQVDHDWSGTFGHNAGRWLRITANADHLEMLVRYDPTGETIHYQWIEDWRSYDQKYCRPGEHPTIYVGGTYHHTDDYNIHCSTKTP